MTGGDISLETILAVVSALLGALGTAFGWPVLVKIADWIKARDEAGKLVAAKDDIPTTPRTDVTDSPQTQPQPPKEPL
jgi:hypothetical protein